MRYYLLTTIAILAGWLAYGQSHIQVSTGSTSGNIYHTGGNIGIGTTSPGLPLHIYGSSAGLYLDNSGANKYYISSQSGSFLQFGLSGGGDAQSFVLRNGQIGIGTALPGLPLHISGINAGLYLDNTAANNYYISSHSNSFLQFGLSGGGDAESFVLRNGNIGIGTTSPGLPLHISGGDAGLYLDNTTANKYYISSHSSSFLQFGLSGGGDEESFVLRNGNIGIGTTIPGLPLHISGSDAGLYLDNTGANKYYISSDPGNFLKFGLSGGGDDQSFVLRNGSVGIGTTTPELPLHISAAGAGLYLDNTAASKFYITSQSGNYLQIGLSGGGNQQSLVLNGGNVGIGTTSPSAKLEVDGNIITEEVKVQDVSGADFVFEEDYALPTLSQVESFINQNGHLPDIPPATEMQENGIELGDMNMKLLQKIEELTLYVLALNERQAQLEKENKVLSTIIKSLDHDE